MPLPKASINDGTPPPKKEKGSAVPAVRARDPEAEEPQGSVPEVAIARRFNVETLIERAVEGKADVSTIERLVAMATEIRKEQARAAWHEAMAAFQAEAPEIVKTKTANVTTRTGGKFSYQYAALQDLIPIVRPILAKHGLSVVFTMEQTETTVTAICRVAHNLGHVEVCPFGVPIGTDDRIGNPAQRVASASTYARRYAYLSALGLAPEDDDDAQSASESKSEAEPERKSAPAPKPSASGKAQDVPNPWIGRIVSADEPRKGQTGKNQWVAYVFHGDDGASFGTYDENVMTKLVSHMGQGDQVTIVWTVSSKGYRIIEEVS